MNTCSIKQLAAVGLLALTSFAAQAQNTILGSSFTNGASYQQFLNFGGTTADFTSAPGNFEKKSQDGITGVGVSGATSGEIDIREVITGTFGAGVLISNIRLGLLFDGPEYNDVQEVAKISYWYGNNQSGFITLTATGTTSAVLTGSGSYKSVGSGAVNGGTGAWDIFNPFGNTLVTKISFEALTGVSAGGCSGTNGVCTNQSDYTLVSVTAVPEPETYAMMLAGLGLLGAIARRRKLAAQA